MSITYLASGCTLNKLFGGIDFTPPSSLWLGLSTTNISNSGSNATEPTGANYSRVEITNDKSHFTYASSACIVTVNTESFSQSSGSWGTILDVGLWDASTNGNIWFFQTLASSKVVQSDTTVSFAASAIAISMKN